MGFNEKTIESEMIYEGKILNLRRDKVETKSGRLSYREIVEHRGGAVAVAVTQDEKIVMVKQFRKAMERDVLELPAGKLEENEEPIEAIKRELSEETGYRAKDIKLMSVFHPSVGYTSEALYIFLAMNLEKGSTNFDEDEDLEIVEIPFKEAVDMVVRGDIMDGKSIAGILLASYHM